jgi:osmoprotectant transport system substrate-binding protein
MKRKSWTQVVSAGTAVVSMLILVLGVGCGGGSGTATPLASTSTQGSTVGSATETPAGTAEATRPAGTIIVGSKNFTEEFILAEMYALVLENAGFKVERKFDLGGTPVAQAAITSGQIDLYPEYTGTALLTVLKLPTEHNAEKVYQTVSKQYKQKFHLIWLDESPMNDSQALAMTQQASQKYGITDISQMATQASELVMIGPPEFESRQDGLPGLKRVYGDFTLKKYISVSPGLRYQGLLSGDADVVVAFTTDWQIAADNLVVLKDNKGLFPPYHIAPVVREDVLNANPDIATVLNDLAPKITTEVMQKLNGQVGEKQLSPADVAKEFLIQEGLIPKMG